VRHSSQTYFSDRPQRLQRKVMKSGLVSLTSCPATIMSVPQLARRILSGVQWIEQEFLVAGHSVLLPRPNFQPERWLLSERLPPPRTENPPAMPLGLKPIDSGFDHAKILVDQPHRRADIDPALRPILELFPKSLAMRSEILERVTIFQGQIPIDDQFNCLRHNQIYPINTPSDPLPIALTGQ
jgi:hypothetical protein